MKSIQIDFFSLLFFLSIFESQKKNENFCYVSLQIPKLTKMLAKLTLVKLMLVKLTKMNVKCPTSEDTETLATPRRESRVKSS